MAFYAIVAVVNFINYFSNCHFSIINKEGFAKQGFLNFFEGHHDK